MLSLIPDPTTVTRAKEKKNQRYIIYTLSLRSEYTNIVLRYVSTIS
jgi:hypothetical protein